jgi:hypothetical protein
MRTLQRFIDRRGCPEQMTSDNSRNFENCELNELYKQIDQNGMTIALVVQQIIWNLNPQSLLILEMSLKS